MFKRKFVITLILLMPSLSAFACGECEYREALTGICLPKGGCIVKAVTQPVTDVVKGAKELATTGKTGGVLADTVKAASQPVKDVVKGAGELITTGKTGGVLADTVKQAGNATANLDEWLRTGKCGGDICNEWERSIKPHGQKAGKWWDKTIKPIGVYIEKNPVESAIIIASIAYGGYLLAYGSPEVTISWVVETSSGYTAVPIATFSSTSAGGAGLVAGGAGVLNALNKEPESPSKADLRKVEEFKKDMENQADPKLPDVAESYSRHYDVAKYGRNPKGQVYILRFPLEGFGKSPPEKMAEIIIAAPIQDKGGDILTTGDFFNLRPPSANTTVAGDNVKRIHAAYDISANPNAVVYAPMTGTITKINYPYGSETHPKSGQMIGLTITSPSGISSQIFYVKPTTEIMSAITSADGKGIEVYAGESVIGNVQDVNAFYVERGSNTPPKNHVHLAFLDKEGRRLSLDGKRVVVDEKK